MGRSNAAIPSRRQTTPEFGKSVGGEESGPRLTLRFLAASATAKLSLVDGPLGMAEEGPLLCLS